MTNLSVIYRANVCVFFLSLIPDLNQQNFRDGVFCFVDTHSWFKPTVSGTIPNARDGHSACVINNKMFVFGGYEEEVKVIL